MTDEKWKQIIEKIVRALAENASHIAAGLYVTASEVLDEAFTAIAALDADAEEER